MSENCTVRFLSSSPEIKVRADTGLSDVAITANARQSVELEFRPLLAGSSEHLLNGVDSNSGLVRFSFLVACHATDPVIDYKFELSLPLGVDAKRVRASYSSISSFPPCCCWHKDACNLTLKNHHTTCRKSRSRIPRRRGRSSVSCAVPLISCPSSITLKNLIWSPWRRDGFV